jgi:NitT/TauT family transport system ATP-binding protein
VGAGDLGMTALLELSGVGRSFSGRRSSVEALRDVSLEVAEGEFIAVIGRSGCGKSTLLRLIAGLLSPSSGTVSLGGSPVVAPRRDVALMFQRAALLPWRSALANVLLPAEMLGLDKVSQRSRALQLLETVGLAEFADRLPHELSGGMQQRVALCRALVQQPRLLLMDEPFSALDALTREELATELQRVHTDSQATTILVTHSIQEAVLLADRVVVLSDRPGRIARVLPVPLSRPRSLTEGAQLAESSELVAQLHKLLLDTGTTPALRTDPADCSPGRSIRRE